MSIEMMTSPVSTSNPHSQHLPSSQQQQQQQLLLQTLPITPIQNMIAGAGSGFLTRLLVAPLDVLKVRFQLQTNKGQYYRSIPHAFYRIARDEGPKALWKGNLLATMMSSPYTAITITTHKIIKQNAFSNSNDPLANAIAGASAGIVATAMTYPFDLLRSRFIAQKGFAANISTPNTKAISSSSFGYTSIYNAVTTIYRKSGIMGYFEGMTPALVGIVPYMAVQFAVYEGSKAYLTKNLDRSVQWAANLIGFLTQMGSALGLSAQSQDELITRTHLKAISLSAELQGPPSALTTTKTPPQQPKEAPFWVVPIVGLISGTCGKAISFPMDLIKRRMQMATFEYTFDQKSRPKTSNMFVLAKHIYQTEGFFAFYKGLIPSLLKSGPSASLVFMFYEGILRILRSAPSAQQKQQPII